MKTGSLCCALVLVTSITWDIKIDPHFKYIYDAMIIFFFFNSTSTVRPSLTSSSGGVINRGIGKGWSDSLAVIESWSHTPLRCGLAVTLWPPSQGGPYRRDYRSTIRSQGGCNAVLSSFESSRTNSWFLSDFVCRSAAWPIGLQCTQLQNLNCWGKTLFDWIWQRSGGQERSPTWKWYCSKVNWGPLSINGSVI